MEEFNGLIDQAQLEHSKLMFELDSKKNRLKNLLTRNEEINKRIKHIKGSSNDTKNEIIKTESMIGECQKNLKDLKASIDILKNRTALSEKLKDCVSKNHKEETKFNDILTKYQKLFAEKSKTPEKSVGILENIKLKKNEIENVNHDIVLTEEKLKNMNCSLLTAKNYKDESQNKGLHGMIIRYAQFYIENRELEKLIIAKKEQIRENMVIPTNKLNDVDQENLYESKSPKALTISYNHDSQAATWNNHNGQSQRGEDDDSRIDLGRTFDKPKNGVPNEAGTKVQDNSFVSNSSANSSFNTNTHHKGRHKLNDATTFINGKTGIATAVVAPHPKSSQVTTTTSPSPSDTASQKCSNFDFLSQYLKIDSGTEEPGGEVRSTATGKKVLSPLQNRPDRHGKEATYEIPKNLESDRRNFNDYFMCLPNFATNIMVGTGPEVIKNVADRNGDSDDSSPNNFTTAPSPSSQYSGFTDRIPKLRGASQFLMTSTPIVAEDVGTSDVGGTNESDRLNFSLSQFKINYLAPLELDQTQRVYDHRMTSKGSKELGEDKRNEFRGSLDCPRYGVGGEFGRGSDFRVEEMEKETYPSQKSVFDSYQHAETKRKYFESQSSSNSFIESRFANDNPGPSTSKMEYVGLDKCLTRDKGFALQTRSQIFGTTFKNEGREDVKANEIRANNTNYHNPHPYKCSKNNETVSMDQTTRKHQIKDGDGDIKNCSDKYEQGKTFANTTGLTLSENHFIVDQVIEKRFVENMDTDYTIGEDSNVIQQNKSYPFPGFNVVKENRDLAANEPTGDFFGNMFANISAETEEGTESKNNFFNFDNSSEQGDKEMAFDLFNMNNNGDYSFAFDKSLSNKSDDHEANSGFNFQF